jgi:ketosteroid isomerase-like protein
MRTRILVTVILLFVVGLVLWTGPLAAQDAAAPMAPGEVVAAVYAALEAGDVPAALEFLAGDAVLTLVPAPEGMDGTFVGKEEIGAWYEGLAAGHGRFEISDVMTAGNRTSMHLAFSDDFFDSLSLSPAEFDGAAVVQDGKVKSLSWVFTPEFAAKMDAAMGKAGTLEVITRYMDDLWNEGDLAVVDEVIAEEFVSHNRPAGEGREFMRGAVTSFREANPGVYFPLHEIVVADEHVFVFTIMMQRPEGADATVEGEPISAPMILVLDVEDGQITDRWLYFAAE